MQLPDSDIKTIQKYFIGKPVKKAFLFGSYVRGSAELQSDVDILVELDYTIPIGLYFVQMKFDLEDSLNKSVDLVSTDGLSEFVAPFIHKEKQLIYERR
jgi:predicted nucleotidyltransferase